jgi:hypothetical protein
VAPLGDDCPGTHPIKALASTAVYHAPGAPAYTATRPEVCLATHADAETAGFKPAT